MAWAQATLSPWRGENYSQKSVVKLQSSKELCPRLNEFAINSAREQAVFGALKLKAVEQCLQIPIPVHGYSKSHWFFLSLCPFFALFVVKTRLLISTRPLSSFPKCALVIPLSPGCVFQETKYSYADIRTTTGWLGATSLLMMIATGNCALMIV